MDRGDSTGGVGSSSTAGSSTPLPVSTVNSTVSTTVVVTPASIAPATPAIAVKATESKVCSAAVLYTRLVSIPSLSAFYFEQASNAASASSTAGGTSASQAPSQQQQMVIKISEDPEDQVMRLRPRLIAVCSWHWFLL
jgi:hypothetical protein